MTTKTLTDILRDLESGNIQSALDLRGDLGSESVRILNEPILTPDDKEKLKLLIMIGNASYENYPHNLLPIEDGVYDLLAVKLQNEDYEAFKVGSKPIHVNVAKLDTEVKQVKYPFTIPSIEDITKMENLLYPETLNNNKPMMRDDVTIKPFTIQHTGDLSKRLRNTAHVYPNLVGTLEKCKFVLDSQAIEKGRFDDANVKIFERDFMVPLIQSGIINQIEEIVMVATLKYDGVSVEGEVTDVVQSARTRGDTDLDEASDLTPIFKGYRFPRASALVFDYPIGMKFEAIITKTNLSRLNALLGTNYINGRTAIIGILGRTDAYKYRDFITLIPLQVDFGDGPRMDRVSELEFLNKYYTTQEYTRYTVFKAQFNQLMFMVYKYTEEAEYIRQFMPFMYDGVVLEFYDESIRNALGRKNHINQYAMAIKFNPLKKQTIFRGYTYTIGKNGLITPMIYYDPIEFFGAIHNHSTGSSYSRFYNLDLHIGDIIDVEYTNDVMPYVTKPDNPHNRQNAESTPSEQFPKYCPCCGTELILSDSGKSAKCPNKKCREVVRQRLAGMMSNLKLVGFSEESIAALPHIGSFGELMEASEKDLEALGSTNKVTLYNMIQEMKTTEKRRDDILMSALGFSNIASKTWKKILSNISLVQIYEMYHSDKDTLRNILANIKTIGPVTADTIVEEFETFDDDIKYILDHNMYIPTPIGFKSKAKVRFTGFRDPVLEELLQVKGIDADGNAGVTKDTTLLLVATPGTTGTKVNKAKGFGIPIVTVAEFKANIAEYLDKWEVL